MSVTFPCRVCHREITVNFLAPGETAQCKHCGADNVVPGSGEKRETSDVIQSSSDAPEGLRSAGMARGLLLFLWVQLGLDIAMFILAYMSRDMSTPIGHTAFGPVLVAVVGASTLVSIVAIVVFFVWLFDLHRDLADQFRSYPITPMQAFLRLLLPFYNLWGTWNVFVTMVRTFEEDSDALRKSGTTLYSWLIVMYSALVLSYLYVGEKIITAFQPQVVISYQNLFTGWDLFGIVLAVVTLIAYIGMTQTISLAMNEKSGMIGSNVPDGWSSQTAS